MRHSLIVGGSKGLGRALAQKMISRGDKVSVISRSTPANKVGGVDYFEADIADAASLTLAMDKVTEASTINYLVFCQRFRGQGDSWEGEIDVSISASRTIIDYFQDKFSAEDNSIVFVSSVFGEYVGEGQALSYHLGKAGMNSLMRFYAVNLGKKGIRTNAVTPFTFIKDESKDFYNGQTELLNMYKEIVPLSRIGSADEIGDVILFFCSEKSRYVNGQNIYIDGGLSLVWPESIAKLITKI